MIPNSVTLVYRAFNDSHLIIPIFNFLSNKKIFPILALDSRSSENQKRIYRNSGITFFEMHNTNRYAESALKDLVKNISTSFYLLLDSDELIFNFDTNEIEYLIESNNFDLVGLKRIWLKSHKGILSNKFKYLKSNSKLIKDDIQWRLVRKSAVKFHTELKLHSNGFDFENPDRITICEKNQILHLDWIVNKPIDRLNKLINYAQFDNKFLHEFLHYYLPELDLEEHQLKKIKLDRHLYTLFSELNQSKKTDISWWQYDN